jgi:CRISPR system Cascade subunit CasC
LLTRTARVFARENYTNIEFVGVRSRRLVEPFGEAFTSLKLPKSDARKKTDEVRQALSKLDSTEESLVTTAVFMSPNEVNRIAKAVSEGKSTKEAAKNANIVDAVDITLFGRMVANDPSINVDAASMFSHALSVHKSTNDLDFFTAVDGRYIRALALLFFLV